MNRIGVLLGIMAPLFGCSLPPIVQIQSAPQIPKEWGDYTEVEAGGSLCPDVAGTYANKPNVYKLGGERGQFYEGKDINFYALFSLYLATTFSEMHSFDQNDVDLLILEQEGEHYLILTHSDPGLGKIFRYRFDRTEGDFDCKDGFLEFPVKAHYGSAEGMSLNGQTKDKIRSTASGDLVAISSFGPYRSRNPNVANEFTHEFYLYKRVNDSP